MGRLSRPRHKHATKRRGNRIALDACPPPNGRLRSPRTGVARVATESARTTTHAKPARGVKLVPVQRFVHPAPDAFGGRIDSTLRKKNGRLLGLPDPARAGLSLGRSETGSRRFVHTHTLRAHTRSPHTPRSRRGGFRRFVQRSIRNDCSVS